MPITHPQSLTGAQRRALRALGHHLHPVVQIGVRGLCPTVIQAVRDQLAAHELIKISFGRDIGVEAKAGAAQLAAASGSHVAGQVGRTALLYRRHPERPSIQLPGVIVEADFSKADPEETTL